MLKAYNTYWGKEPWDDGCILVFAYTRNEAKNIGYKKGPWIGSIYLEMNAVRAKGFDKYAKGFVPYIVESNDELPEPFFDEEYKY